MAAAGGRPVSRWRKSFDALEANWPIDEETVGKTNGNTPEEAEEISESGTASLKGLRIW